MTAVHVYSCIAAGEAGASSEMPFVAAASAGAAAKARLEEGREVVDKMNAND